jgi:endonuclease/exonuclease/phosphatase family metal-dependent hydrolase
MSFRKTILVWFVMLIAYGVRAQEADLKVMTFNIRYDNPDDSIYSWSNRKTMVFDMLGQYKPAILCVQEALKGQADQLKKYLKGYTYCGVGRDDGMEAGEYSAIFYDSTRFVNQGGSTFWLSETPGVPGSKSWNTACTRIVTWARLFDTKKNRQLLVFNTHFDHVSEEARQKSARLLSARMSMITGTENVILTGDFNSTDTSAAYRTLTDTASAFPVADTRILAGVNFSGPPYTFIGFPFNPMTNEIIDFIFIADNRELLVTGCRIIDYHMNDKYPSDHLPVLTEFKYINK